MTDIGVRNKLGYPIRDLHGNPVHVGDILSSVYGYRLLVCQDADGAWGKLVRDADDLDQITGIDFRYQVDLGHFAVWRAWDAVE